MRIAEMEQMLRDDPDLEIIFTVATPYGDPVQLGRIGPDSRFKELIKDIKRRNPGNTIDGSWT